MFAHNGNLVDFAAPEAGVFQPVGVTDSEAAFCALLHGLRRAFPEATAHNPPSVAQITSALNPLVAQIATHGTFNFCLSNGQAMWAHCSTDLYYIVREHPFTTAHLKDADVLIDFAQHTTPDDRVAVIATQPLTDNETWHKMAQHEFLVFKDGQPCACRA